MLWLNNILSRFSRSRLNRSKAKPDSGPLGLSPQDLEALDHLRSTPAWRHYSRALEVAFNQQLSAILRPLPHDGYLFQCGVLFALERAATLVDDLLIARDRHARQSPDPTPPDARHAINSVWWDAYRRTASQYAGRSDPVARRS